MTLAKQFESRAGELLLGTPSQPYVGQHTAFIELHGDMRSGKL